MDKVHEAQKKVRREIKHFSNEKLVFHSKCQSLINLLSHVHLM